LTSIGFVKSKSNSSLFIFHNCGATVYILIYVYDIIITGSIQESVRSVITSLSLRFSLKDLVLLHYFLGIEVISTPTVILLSQQKYVMDLLDELNMTDCKGVPTPMTSPCTFADSEADSVVDISLYRRVIGKLHYLSFTRPDIGFAVSKLSQFMHNPKVSHWKAIKRLLRYLKHTSTLGVQLSREPADRLLAYSDSDWAGNPQDRTSTTGYVVYLGNSPVSWSSKKQKSVSRSSTEAEYRVVATVVSEVNWLTNLLRELHISLFASPTVFCDNVSTTYICANPVFHRRMKHIAIDFHFVREQVQQKALEVRHLHSTDQVADVLTKPLPRTAFQRHFHKLGLVPVTPNLRGSIKR